MRALKFIIAALVMGGCSNPMADYNRAISNQLAVSDRIYSDQIKQATDLYQAGKIDSQRFDFLISAALKDKQFRDGLTAQHIDQVNARIQSMPPIYSAPPPQVEPCCAPTPTLSQPSMLAPSSPPSNLGSQYLPAPPPPRTQYIPYDAVSGFMPGIRQDGTAR